MKPPLTFDECNIFCMDFLRLPQVIHPQNLVFLFNGISDATACLFKNFQWFLKVLRKKKIKTFIVCIDSLHSQSYPSMQQNNFRNWHLLERQNSLSLANHDDPTPLANDWFWNQGLRQLMLDIPLIIFTDGAVGMMTRLSQSKTEVRKFYSTNRSIPSFPILR